MSTSSNNDGAPRISSDDDVTSLEELQKTAQSELESLGRVSHRLALTESGGPLEKVLNLLLPRLLKRIGSNNKRSTTLTSKSNSSNTSLKDTYNKIHSKLVQMLSHTMKRVRADKNCKLPCSSILDLLYDNSTYMAFDPSTIDPFTINLSLAFLTLGIPRCSKPELESLLPGLLSMVGAHSGIDSYKNMARKNQSSQVGHMLLRALEAVVTGDSNIDPMRQQKQYNSDTQQSNENDKQLDAKSIQDRNDFITKMRQICFSQQSTAAAIYDLFLDILLYQPSSSNLNGNAGALPPLGLSQTGFERLAMGTSTTEKNWIVEYLPKSRLKTLKIAIIDFIAPCRRWAIFINDSVSENNNNFGKGMGIARTVALLAVACGDSHVDVAEKASNHLKVHMDSRRNINKDLENKEIKSHNHFSQLLGNHLSLASSLLSLVVGENVALSLIEKAFAGFDKKPFSLLGVDTGMICQTTPNDDKRIILSTKRRIVSEIFSSSIMQFVSTRIFDEIPDVFKLNNVPTNIRKGDESKYKEDTLKTFLSSAYCLGLLVHKAAEMFIGNGGVSSTSAYVTTRISARVAAASMLNCFCIRASSLCDEIHDFHETNNTNSDNNAVSDEPHTVSILSKSLALASKILQALPSRGTFADNKETIDLRDYCYGILCTIARSKVSNANVLFENADSSSSMISITTASMLFACVANEKELLRPRAVAALDALLSAYCQKYCERVVEQTVPTNQSDLSNPWMNLLDSGTKKNAVSPIINTHNITKSFIPILWSAASPSRPKASRLAAAHWANDFLKTLDYTSGCHILCFLAGDSDATVTTFSKDCLGVDSNTHSNDTVGKKKATSDFSEIVDFIFRQRSDSSSQPSFFEFSIRSQGVALRFGLSSLLDDLYGGENDSIFEYTDALCRSLERFSSNLASYKSLKEDRDSMDFLDDASFCLATCLDISPLIRMKMFSSVFSLTMENIINLALGSSSSKSRKYFSEAVGHLIDDLSLWNSPQNSYTGYDIDMWIDKTKTISTLKICSTHLEAMQKDIFMCSKAHGAAHLGSRLFRSFRLAYLRSKTFNEQKDSELVISYLDVSSKLVVALAEGLLHSDDTISNACASGLGIGFSYAFDDAPLLHRTLFSCTAKAIEKLSFAIKKFGHGDSTNTGRMSSLVYASGVLLASSTSGAGSDSLEGDSSTSLGKARLLCVDTLFFLFGSSSYRKYPELSILIGEALSEYSNAYGPDAVWTISSNPWPDPYDECHAADLPPHSQVIYRILRKETKYSNPHKRNASVPTLLAIVGHAARMVVKGPQFIKRPLIQEILNNLLEIQNTFISFLSDSQMKQLSRESACLGLVACRGLSIVGNAENRPDTKGLDLNQRLLKAFGHSTVYGTSAFAETREQNEERMRQEGRENEANSTSETGDLLGLETDERTEVGGASGVGEAALGAYREMSSAAVALGRPDILYALLVLSATHPVWSSTTFRDRYNASVFLGKSSVECGDNISEMRDAIKPYFPKLIPMLFRACHDPNKQTREQMNSLWLGLTGGGALSRLAITDHLLTTIDVLMKDSSNKSWRARVGACAALSEVIVGRSWDDFGGGEALDPDEVMVLTVVKPEVAAATRLLQLLRLVTRSLDDVRSIVRESGAKLARSVRSLINHLCNPSSSKESENNFYSSFRNSTKSEKDDSSSKAASTALGWLVKYGLNQSCAEATGFCLSTLLCVVDVSTPSTLQPVLPDLIGSLSMAMSGLEPAALNYLQVRAAGEGISESSDRGMSYDQLERVRLQLAQSGPIAAALSKCLDMVKSIDINTQKAVIPHLDSALRCGAGFATRAAVADAVSSLCSLCPSAFKFDGNSSTNPTVRLLRALYFASERERGVGARDKMSFALGNLAELSPGSSVRSLTIRACEKYTCSTGSNDDPAARRAAAAAISAISVRASSQISDGGPNDIWIRRVFPLAFIGKFDKDDKIAALWKNVWDEGGQANVISGKNQSHFGITLEENLLPYITKLCIDALNDVSWSRRIVACSALVDLANKNILAPAPRPLHTKLQNEEFLTRAKRRSKSSSEILSQLVRMIIRNRYWNGKIDVVKAAVKIVCLWSSTSFYDDIGQWAVYGFIKSDDDRCTVRATIPVCIDFESPNDLFRGDRLLEQVSKENVCSDKTDDMETENDEREVVINNDSQITSTEHCKLNFEEMEKNSKEEPQEAGILISEDLNQNAKDDGNSSVTVMGFCRVLVSQAISHYWKKSPSIYENESLLYRAACLQGASETLRSLDSSDKTTLSRFSVYKQSMSEDLTNDLIEIIDRGMMESVSKEKQVKVPPLIIARSIDCVASVFWKNIGSASEKERLLISKALEIFNSNCGGKQSAWTVRESAALGSSELAKFISADQLKKVRIVEAFIDCSIQCLKDKKFWKVRLAGLKILESLCNRAIQKGSIENQDGQIILEALLPHKEQIVKLARRSLSDNESKVTAISSTICGIISWWP